jgi:hypothetical protein
MGMGAAVYKKPDGYGFVRQGTYVNGKARYDFFRETKNADIIMWVSPARTSIGYIVEKSVRVAPFKHEAKIVAQFDTAVEAKKWVNKEYAHMFE